MEVGISKVWQNWLKGGLKGETSFAMAFYQKQVSFYKRVRLSICSCLYRVSSRQKSIIWCDTNLNTPRVHCPKRLIHQVLRARHTRVSPPFGVPECSTGTRSRATTTAPRGCRQPLRTCTSSRPTGSRSRAPTAAPRGVRTPPRTRTSASPTGSLSRAKPSTPRTVHYSLLPRRDLLCTSDDLANAGASACLRIQASRHPDASVHLSRALSPPPRRTSHGPPLGPVRDRWDREDLSSRGSGERLGKGVDRVLRVSLMLRLGRARLTAPLGDVEGFAPGVMARGRRPDGVQQSEIVVRFLGRYKRMG